MKSQRIDYTHLMMEHTPVCTALYDTQEFRILSANPAMLTSLAIYLPDLPYHKAIHGQPLATWFPQYNIEEMMAIFRSVATTAVPYRRTEYPIRLPDGRIAYWNWSLHPITDEQGHILYLLQSSVDVTEQVKLRLAVHHTQPEHSHYLFNGLDSRLLRTILDRFSEGILIVDVASDSTTYANEAAAHFLGISLPTLMQMPLHRHIWSHRRDATDIPSSIKDTQEKTACVSWLFPVVHALCGEIVKDQETLITRPDGSIVNALTSSIPLYSEKGIILGAVVIFQDTSNQKSLDQQKQVFIATASHELRTPITAIQGLAELLQLIISKGQALDSSRIGRILDRLTEQSQHLAHLVNELLDVSLIQQKQFTLNRVRCDLLPLVVRGVELFTEESISHKHSIHLSLEGPVATETLIGRFDKEYIVQILRQLISNAIKYSPAGGHIEVTLRHTPNKPHEVALSIQDEGLGISPQDIPSIFERFRRAETIDSAISGLGIGLYLVKEIVTRHGGRVWAENNDGKGSTFNVVLPLEDKRS